jgi:hypothetical protein
MPHPHEPDPNPSLRGAPLCASCGKTMRLTLTVPSNRYVNLDDCTYRCDCGEESNYVMARKE